MAKKTVWQNRATGHLFATPDAALNKYTETVKNYDYSKHWILPERDGVVVVLKQAYSETTWSIFFQLHLTEIIEA